MLMESIGGTRDVICRGGLANSHCWHKENGEKREP